MRMLHTFCKLLLLTLGIINLKSWIPIFVSNDPFTMKSLEVPLSFKGALMLLGLHEIVNLPLDQ